VKVKDLIARLREFDQNLTVAYCLHSEAKVLEADEIGVVTLQRPRADGWIHRLWGKEPPLPKQEYVLFPGN
jgi:hypothetical protein